MNAYALECLSQVNHCHSECLGVMHNFCIDKMDINGVVPQLMATNSHTIMTNEYGYVELE